MPEFPDVRSRHMLTLDLDGITEIQVEHVYMNGDDPGEVGLIVRGTNAAGDWISMDAYLPVADALVLIEGLSRTVTAIQSFKEGPPDADRDMTRLTRHQDAR